MYVLKETLFCSGGFELVSYLFLLRPVHTMLYTIYHTIIVYYYAQTKAMIYESVNLKGVVYEPKQNSFSLQSITTCTGFANVSLTFIKLIQRALSKFSIELSNYSQRIFINNLIDNNQVMQSRWQIGVANASS